MTAGGYKAEIKDGKVVILQEGAEKKFLKNINQVTFSGPHAVDIDQNVLYITDRCVFKLTKDGLMLTEIAPGIDLKTQILDVMEFEPMIAKELKVMDPMLFAEEPIGLRGAARRPRVNLWHFPHLGCGRMLFGKRCQHAGSMVKYAAEAAAVVCESDSRWVVSYGGKP